jgi:hypothetical protein
LLQLVQDILNFGRPRHLDTGVLETVDLDRILQLKVAWEALKVDPVHLIFGYGYLESSFVLANPLFLLYQKYLPHLDFVKELGSRENVSVYGFSAILVDFGILGIACLVFLFSSQAISLPWKTDPEYSKLWMGCLSIVLVQLFTTNHLGSFFFIVLLTSSITLLCAHYSMNMRLRYI